jgi:hypothetical protein
MFYLLEDTTIEDILKTVVNLHDHKDYRKAIQVLEKDQSNLNPAIRHFNLGILHGKIEEWPLARFYFMLAEIEGYSSKELSINQKLVESKLSILRYEKPLSTQDYIMRGCIDASHGMIAMFSLLFVLVGIISAFKKMSLKLTFASLLTSFFLILFNFWVQSWDLGIVTSPQLIHEGPSTLFETQNEVPAGLMLVTTKHGEWLEIIYPSRFEGWIKDINVKELK